ncbi:hypothetical protein ACIBKY_44310 [Nonomuraea sp. NPDC050394]|uniref:hypothetical protein n=1 Tax=Nonomuraea sp. NPDC050394 TaxID=3364363 RepID=UPI0037BC2244
MTGDAADVQWDLLSSRGFASRFAGTWVEGGDPDVLAEVLRVDPQSRLECDLATAMRWYEPYSNDDIIWIGEHAPGWTHIISISGLGIWPGPLSEHDRRVFFLEYDDGEEGLHGLTYWRDGTRAGDAGRNSNDPGDLAPLFERHGIESDAFDDGEGELNAYLFLLGQITGRFIDEEWLAASRSLYRIPPNAWADIA